jgi:hypothetical protein
MALIQAAGQINGAGGVASLPIGWHGSAGYSRSGVLVPFPSNGPPIHCEVLKSSDTAHYDANPWRWLYCLTQGDIYLELQDGSCVKFPSVAVGTQLNLSFVMFFSISTATIIAGR